MSGATHLAPHHGLINTKLRAHLPLLIPSDPAPVLVVAGQNITWTEGSIFVFDDTFEHEVSFRGVNKRSRKFSQYNAHLEKAHILLLLLYI